MSEHLATISMHRPADLRIHSVAKGMPMMDDESVDWESLIESVARNGVIQPLTIDNQGRIIDGRHRWAAAKMAKLKEVPCIVLVDPDVHAIILESLAQRRHFTKGARAYLAYPYVEEAWNEAKRRRVENLKQGSGPRSSSQDTIGDTVEAFAVQQGFGRNLFFQAKRLHELFAEDESLRAQFEPEILNEGKGLGAIIAGIGGQSATKDKPRSTPRQLDLFTDGFKTVAVRVKASWSKFSDDERAKVRRQIRTDFAATPREFRDDLQKILAGLAKEEGKS